MMSSIPSFVRSAMRGGTSPFAAARASRRSRLRTAALVPILAGAFAASIGSGLAADPAAPQLSLPIVCEPGKTCFIQSYVDTDPGPQAVDFTCGSATYEGHKGTDFRVLSSASAAKGVAVVAAAEGTVKGVRDGMDDALIDESRVALVKNRECGNGVVLDHGGGWETQYCHMRKGSVMVKSGDKIARGQKLGEVGNSGLAEFAHVHLEVRKDGTPIEPFSGRTQSAACSRDLPGNGGLWTAEAAKAFPYANGEIIGSLFSSRPLSSRDLETNDAEPPPGRGASQIYFIARIANIRLGDRVRLVLNGPGGFKQESDGKPLDRNRAMHLEFAYAKTGKGGPLPAGTYKGKVELLRGTSVISSRENEIVLGP
ncbi:MAG: M23 family metallopeptidase [Hyphomicrobium sp.]